MGEAEAEALNPGFIKRMRDGMPWVRVKQAATLDGRTALADGRSQWITGDEARADVMRWRARSSVILAGADTVLADDPALNVRWQALPAAVQADYALTDVRQPVRVIVDSRNRVAASAKLFSCPGPVWMARADNKPAWPAGDGRIAGAHCPVRQAGFTSLVAAGRWPRVASTRCGSRAVGSCRPCWRPGWSTSGSCTWHPRCWVTVPRDYWA